MPMTQELCRVHGCSQHNDGHTEHDTDLVLHCVCAQPARRADHLPECLHCGRFIYVPPAEVVMHRVKISGDYGSLEVSKIIEVYIPPEYFVLDDPLEQEDMLAEICYEEHGIGHLLTAAGYDWTVGEVESWTNELLPPLPRVEP